MRKIQNLITTLILLLILLAFNNLAYADFYEDETFKLEGFIGWDI